MKVFLDVLLSPADFLGSFFDVLFFNQTTVVSPRYQFANDQLTNFEVDSPTFA